MGLMLIERIAAWGEAKFSAPTSNGDLAAGEAALGAALPPQLRELLSETDGVGG